MTQGSTGDAAQPTADPSTDTLPSDAGRSGRANPSEHDRAASLEDTLGQESTGPDPTGPQPTDLEARHAQNAIAARLFGAGRVNPQPMRIGRFTVLERLGAGAMGIVYAAYDDQLDRRVAIKVLHGEAEADEELGRRLLREAKAMAQLAHPNVAVVHEVGRFEGRVFVAMEFVKGRTLRSWLGLHASRAQDEVLAMFVQAGEGLAAAHSAGLVHRDFKPDNVLVGDDGRARVVDFGLARARRDGEDEATNPALGLPTHDDASVDATLTRTGARMGTPRYMAPEQHRGTTTDGRTDQFAFCVAVWEALYGQPPFEGETMTDLAVNVTEGRLVPAPRGVSVPARIHRALLRGISPSPDDRHRDMGAVLAELRHDPGQAKRRWMVAAGGATVLAVSVAVSTQLAAEPQDDACTGGTAAMEAIWNAERRAELADAFERSGAPFARNALHTTSDLLDDYTSRWAAAHRDVCETNRRGEASDAQLDATMACLGHLEAGLSTLVDVLGEADAKVVPRAVEATLSLGHIEPCRDADALATWLRPPDDPRLRDAVNDLRDRIARADALEDVGRYDAAIRDAEALTADAMKLDYAPVRAEALRMLGDMQDRTGDGDAAIETLGRALREAQAGRHLQVMVEGSLDLAYVLGYRKGGEAEATRLLDLGMGALEAMGGSDTYASEFAHSRGALAFAQGRYDEAEAGFREAIVLRTRALGPEIGGQTVTVANLGNVLMHLGRVDEARDTLLEAKTKMEHERGPEHPEVATVHLSLGNVEMNAGDLPLAQQYVETALAMRRAKLDEGHADIATALGQLGVIHAMQGHLDEALSLMQESRRIYEASYGRDHGETAAVISNTAVVLNKLGRDEESLELERLALEIRERVTPDHPGLATSYSNVAAALDDAGEHEQAREYFEKAVAHRGRTLGPDHLDNVPTLVGLGITLLRLERPQDALTRFEEALRVAEGATEGRDTELLGRARLWLAKTLWDHGGDRERAHALAESARVAYASSTKPEKTDEVDTWLTEHPAP